MDSNFVAGIIDCHARSYSRFAASQIAIVKDSSFERIFGFKEVVFNANVAENLYGRTFDLIVRRLSDGMRHGNERAAEFLMAVYLGTQLFNKLHMSLHEHVADNIENRLIAGHIVYETAKRAPTLIGILNPALGEVAGAVVSAADAYGQTRSLKSTAFAGVTSLVAGKARIDIAVAHGTGKISGVMAIFAEALTVTTETIALAGIVELSTGEKQQIAEAVGKELLIMGAEKAGRSRTAALAYASGTSLLVDTVPAIWRALRLDRRVCLDALTFDFNITDRRPVIYVKSKAITGLVLTDRNIRSILQANLPLHDYPVYHRERDASQILAIAGALQRVDYRIAESVAWNAL